MPKFSSAKYNHQTENADTRVQQFIEHALQLPQRLHELLLDNRSPYQLCVK